MTTTTITEMSQQIAAAQATLNRMTEVRRDYCNGVLDAAAANMAVVLNDDKKQEILEAVKHAALGGTRTAVWTLAVGR